MKKIVFLLTFFLSGNLCFGQQQAVTYDYDRAGNRIARSVITLYSSQRSAMAQNPDEQETISNPLLTCEVTIYPNPTVGEVTLSVLKGEEDAVSTVFLYTSAGKLLKKLELTGNTSVSIDLSSYEPGIYMVDFSQGDNKSFYKIIKQ